MAPDGISALGTAAGFFTLAGMNSLEVIDIAVGLVEVPIAIIIVAIPDIKLGQVSIDLGRCFTGSDLGVVPGIQRVAYEHPGVGTDDIAAVIRAVSGFIVWNLHPIGYIAVDRITVGGFGDIEVAHRNSAGSPGEEQVLIIRLAEIRRPDGRVINGAVRLGDLVVQRTRCPAV